MAEAESNRTETPVPRRIRRRRTRRRVLIGVGVVVLLLVVLVLLVPTIGARFAPRAIAGAINDSINGTSTINSASFSWFGDQRIGPIIIRDAAGEVVADVTVHVDRGLMKLGLAGLGVGPLDLGQSRLTGSVTIVRDTSGVLNLQKLAKPSPVQPQQKPARIPPTLAGGFVLDGLDVRFIDEGKLARSLPASVVHLPDLGGQLAIADGSAISANLSGNVRAAPTLNAPERPAGRFKFVGSLGNLTDAQGYITPELAVIDADIEAGDLASAVADTLAGMDNRLAAALGETLQADLAASGSLQKATATVRVTSPSTALSASVEIADRVLTTTTPATLTAQGATVVALAPGLADSLAGSDDVRFEQLPDLKATLSGLRIRIPESGRPLDLRGTSFTADLETTEAIGTVRIAESGASQPFTVAPIHAALSTPDLARSLAMIASTSTTLAGRPAGQVSLDLSALEPLDKDGALREDLVARLRGSTEISELATAIADPFVQPFGIDLTRDVGPTLNASFRATTRAAAEPTADGAIPATDASFSIEAANLRSSGQIVFDGRILRTGEQGLHVRMGQAAPLLAAALAGSGLTVESAGPVEITATDVAIDVRRLRASDTPDLRSISGILAIRSGPSSGTLTLAQQPARGWTLAPVDASLNVSDIASGVRLRASTAATLESAPAGELNIDMVATDLFEADGSLGTAPAINGRAVLQNIATAGAQPFVDDLGLDLPSGVGPHLNLTIAASSSTADQAAARTTDLDITLRSGGVNADFPLSIAGGVISQRGEGVQATVRDIGALVGPAAAKGRVAMSSGGYLKLVATRFAVPYREEDPLAKTAAALEVTTGNFSVTPLDSAEASQAAAAGATAPSEPVAIKQLLASAELNPGEPATVQVRGSGSHAGAAPFLIQADLTLPGLGTRDAPPPLGTVELRNVPTTLVSLASGLSGGGGLSPLEIARSVIGGAVNLTLASSRPDGASGRARTLALEVQSPGLNGSAGATLSEKEFALRELGFTGRLTPELAARVIDVLSPGLASRPRLEGPSMISIAATPFTVPLGEGAKPNLRQAGKASFTVALEGTTRVTNIAVRSEGGPRDIGAIGIRDLALTAEVPVASLTPGGQPGQAEASLVGVILGAEGQELATLDGDARVTLAAAKPTSDLQTALDLTIRDTQSVDTILNRRGLLADGIGPEATIRTTTEVKFAPDAPEGGVRVAQTIFHAGIESAKLRTKEPLHLEVFDDRIILGHPAQLSWLMEPAWANWYLLQAGAALTEEQVRFVSPAEVSLDIYRLAVATGAGHGPLLPGIFDFDTRIVSPGARIMIGEEQGDFRGFEARVRRSDEPGTLGFSMVIQDAGAGPAPDGKPAVNGRGFISSVADPGGQITTDRALITGSFQAIAFPTPIIDAAAKQNGLLVEALGPTTSLRLVAKSLSRLGGNLDVVGTSPRAEARIAGTMHEGALIAQGTSSVTLKVVTPEFGHRMLKGVPLISAFEKTQAQAPAVISATNLTVPIDGDLSKLNGDVVADLGEAEFATSNLFSRFLKAAGAPGAGVVGRRFEPVTIVVRNGVATYERFTIPLGEFSVDMTGTINLVTKQMDAITYVPLGALTDEAAGILNSGLGGVLGGAIPTLEEATMVPLRVSGSFSNPQVRLDPELFVRNAGNTLLRPDRLIGGSIKDIFDKLGGRNGNR